MTRQVNGKNKCGVRNAEIGVKRHLTPASHRNRMIFPTTPTPAIPEKITGCRDLFTGKKLKYDLAQDGALHITGLNRTAHPADTVIMIQVKTAQKM